MSFVCFIQAVEIDGSDLSPASTFCTLNEVGHFCASRGVVIPCQVK